MSARVRRVVFTLALAVLAAPSALAQQASPSPSDGSMLRVEQERWGRRAVYAGTERVGGIGIVRSDLERVVAESEEAVRHARLARREKAMGNALVAFGVSASAALLGSYVAGDEFGMGGWESAAMLAGAGAAGYGTYRLTLSDRALERCLSAFNRDRK